MRLLLALLILLVSAVPVRSETIAVSAAISLKESLSEIRDAYEAKTGDQIKFNFDASGKLVAQIQQGAPADLLISADNEQMDKLAKADLIDDKSRAVIVKNTLVLIVPANAKNPPTGFADLATNTDGKIAVGEPNTVPAGHYAVQTLKALKLDKAVADRLVYGESVRTVLTYVEQGEVSAGIVYGTDARQAGDKVKVIATAEASTHDKIEYPAAVIRASEHAASAQKFLDYLASPEAKKILTAHGFTAGDTATTRPAP